MDYNKQSRGKRVALTHSSGRTEESKTASIKRNRVPTIAKIPKKRVTPSVVEPKVAETSKEKSPLNPIERLGHIKFNNDITPFVNVIHQLMRQTDAMMNATPLDERLLFRRNNGWKNLPEPVRKNLGNDFVNEIAETRLIGFKSAKEDGFDGMRTNWVAEIECGISAPLKKS